MDCILLPFTNRLLFKNKVLINLRSCWYLSVMTINKEDLNLILLLNPQHPHLLIQIIICHNYLHIILPRIIPIQIHIILFHPIIQIFSLDTLPTTIHNILDILMPRRLSTLIIIRAWNNLIILGTANKRVQYKIPWIMYMQKHL